MLFKTSDQYLTYVRNFIFGVEDSLVSTVGLLSGIAFADVSRTTIVLTGVVLIFVEAFSMGVGSYLSEHSVANFDGKTPSHTPILAGVIMLISYLLAGLIPLLPYVFFTGSNTVWISISFSLVALFILGTVSAKLLKFKALTSGIRMFILGGLAIMVGVVVGKVIKN